MYNSPGETGSDKYRRIDHHFPVSQSVYHVVRKVNHGVRKLCLVVRKVYHGVRKVYHVVRKVYHGASFCVTSRTFAL